MAANEPLKLIHERAAEISKMKWEQLKSVVKRDTEFSAYENILCVFQTFNKSHLLKMVLAPFIKTRFKNIMLFADGCIDETVSEAQTMLTGKKHAIVVFNDLHEIHNYRFCLTSEWGRQSEFALLMQDDDLYPVDFEWLDYGLEMMTKDPKLVVIGYRSGFYYKKICPASLTFESDPFYWEGNMMGAPGGSRFELIEGADIGAFGLNFKYCDIVIRSPHLIRVADFLEHTQFDPLFEPFQDDDSNYCLQLWRKGYRVGLVGGARIARDVGIGGMRLSNQMTPHSRPTHTKRNHNYLHERYESFINSGELAALVRDANDSIAKPPKKLLYL